MKFIALGGGSEVGASCSLMEIDGCRVLVDAGIRVGGSRPGGDPLDVLPDLALLQEWGAPDAVLVTHAHLDHIGALPLVHQAYPNVPIYATAPTVHLMRVLLVDAIKVMAIKAERELECPLYDADLVGQMFNRVTPVNMGGPISLSDTVRATFFPGGHILGAAMIGLEGAEGKVLVTGDVSANAQRTIPGLVIPPFSPDLVITESTYGSRLHANRQREELGLAEAVADVVRNGGHALIPAFALGRAQEVILILQAFQQANRIPRFPIWVDGMVRSVCEAYVNYPESLCRSLQKVVQNGGNPFFLNKTTTRAVTNAAQREKVLAGPPACIVASSGMLSGGPSQFYASRLASGEAHGILLCGYQDEESPGRKLLNLAEKFEGVLELDGGPVPVRCRVEKYGLSAHADAGELSGLISRLKPAEVILVHGDAGARGALARSLAATVKVHLPENGEVIEFRFHRDPVVLQPVRQKGPDRPGGIGQGAGVDLARLWEYLVRDSAAASRMYTPEELATLWYGAGSSVAAGEEVGEKLQQDGRYFSPDWRYTFFYRPRKPGQMALVRKREDLMRRYRDLPGHLVLLKDDGGAVRAGVCFAVDEVGFEAWKVGKKSTHHPAESVLEVIGAWEFTAEPPRPEVEKPRLHRLIMEVKPVFRRLKPQQLWDLLREPGEKSYPLEDLMAKAGIDPASRTGRLALAWRLHAHPDYFAYTRFDEGETLYRAKDRQPGEPDEELPVEDLTDRMEQNEALKLADDLFPPEAGLYRKGVDREQGEITLYFHFPEPVSRKYRQQLAELAGASGWSVLVHSEAHHGALAEAARNVLPSDWAVLKTPSIHREQRQVIIKCVTPRGSGFEQLSQAKDDFLERTGFQLIPVGEGGKTSPAAAVPSTGGAAGGTMEINQTYQLIRNTLASQGAQVFRTSKKQDQHGLFIEVSFITPEVGERYQENLRALADETGWRIKINPEPNQNEVKALVRGKIPPGWGLVKEPGFFKDRQEVKIKLVRLHQDVAGEVEELAHEILALTGYRLVLEMI